MPDLDLDRLVKILGMTGSEHDGEKLAALARAQALLKGAGKGWGDVVGKGGGAAPRIDPALQKLLQEGRLQLARDRAAFEAEKARWVAQQQAWRKMVVKEQEERLARQHQEDLARHCAGVSPDIGGFDPRPFQSEEEMKAAHERYKASQSDAHDGQHDDPRAADAPDEAPRSTKWVAFAKRDPDRAAWLIDNMDEIEFARSLYEWASTRGYLTEGQGTAVDNWAARQQSRSDRRRWR